MKKELEKQLKKLKEEKESLKIQREIMETRRQIEAMKEPGKLQGLGKTWLRGAGVVGKKMGKVAMKVGENLAKTDINAAMGVKGKSESKKKVQD